MTPQTFQTQELPTISQPSPDPHPATEAIVTELRREPVKWTPQTVYLTVIDPAAPSHEANLMRLMVELHDKREDKYMLADLKTNNGSFAFTVQAIRQHFTRQFCIVRSWEPEDGDEF